MAWIVVLQMAINMVLFSLLAWVWYDRRSQVVEAPTPDVSAMRLTLERQIAQFEQDIRHYSERAQEQLRAMSRVTEEASRILRKAQTPTVQFAPSTEECELKAALTVESDHGIGSEKSSSPGNSNRAIPTLADLERTRQRLKSDISVDLRTLLKDQLA